MTQMMNSKRLFSSLAGFSTLLLCIEGKAAFVDAWVVHYPDSGTYSEARSNPDDYSEYTTVSAWVLGTFDGNTVVGQGDSLAVSQLYPVWVGPASFGSLWGAGQGTGLYCQYATAVLYGRGSTPDYDENDSYCAIASD